MRFSPPRWDTDLETFFFHYEVVFAELWTDSEVGLVELLTNAEVVFVKLLTDAEIVFVELLTDAEVVLVELLTDAEGGFELLIRASARVAWWYLSWTSTSPTTFCWCGWGISEDIRPYS